MKKIEKKISILCVKMSLLKKKENYVSYHLVNEKKIEYSNLKSL